MRRLKLTAVTLITTTLLLVGCSGAKLYRDKPPHNLRINTNAKSVKTTLDIYAVDEQCNNNYRGTIELDRKIVDTGIPTEKLSYISIGFAGSSFLRGSRSFTSQGTLIIPRKGYHYAIDTSYDDDIYNVTLYEVNRKTGKKRELEFRGLSSCVK